VHARRLSVALALSIVPCARPGEAEPAQGPQLWSVESPVARVYLLGAAEARDRSWLTPKVRAAFAESRELWKEVPPPGTGGDTNPLREELGYDAATPLLDAVDASLRPRLAAYLRELEIDEASVRSMRPWLVYFTINGAFWRSRPDAARLERADAVLTSMAEDEGKTVRYEFTTSPEVTRFFAGMSPRVQSQHLEMLLDYLDDEKAGRNEEYFGWAVGRPSTRALDRMRERTPELYRVLQVDRNEGWAARIEALLATPGTKFVVVGMNHALGPDGIPSRLRARGLDVRAR
jgi:uncharacterized protein YbaP (TraB family)